MKYGYPTLLLGQVALILQFLIVTARHSNHHRKDMDLCFRCPAGFGVVNRCTKHQDTECAPCQQDYYSSHKSSHRPCYPCSRCGVGLYVAHQCTPVKDTVCDSCHTYQGPHNEDFYDKCVLPPLTNAASSSTERTSETDSVSASLMTNQSSSFGTIFGLSGMLTTFALSIVLAAVIVVKERRALRNKNASKYSYQAVATQEAVML